MAVYFIRAGESGPVKIGKAVNVERRLRLFQTAHHERLTVLRTMPGALREESWLHRHYAAQRIGGEWFAYCEEMLSVEVPEQIAVVEEPKDQKPLPPHSQFMRSVGTLVEIAAGLNRAYPTVAAWYQRGAIPNWEWRDFVNFAASRGVTVTVEQLLMTHPSSKAAA